MPPPGGYGTITSIGFPVGQPFWAEAGRERAAAATAPAMKRRRFCMTFLPVILLGLESSSGSRRVPVSPREAPGSVTSTLLPRSILLVARLRFVVGRVGPL